MGILVIPPIKYDCSFFWLSGDQMQQLGGRNRLPEFCLRFVHFLQECSGLNTVLDPRFTVCLGGKDICTVYRVSIYISLHIKVPNLGNEKWDTVNRSPVNRWFTVITLYVLLVSSEKSNKSLFANFWKLYYIE